MKHKFYVDVPNDYPYVYHGEKLGPEVLRRDFGVNIEFVANSLANLSNGDVHYVEVADDKEELVFLIKSGFEKLNTEVIENYINLRRKK